MTDKVNDTIIKMVTNLKPSVDLEVNNFSCGTPLKRSSSSVSNDSQTSSEESTRIKRMKYAKEMNFGYMASPRETRRLRTDLLEGRNTIMNLESRIQHMHNVRKEMEIMYENESKLLKKQHESDRKSIEELEAQLQSIRQREADLKKQLADVNNKYSMLKVRKDEEIEELEKSLTEMKEESRLFDGEENAEIILLNRKLAELQMMLDAAEEDAEAQKKLVLELEKRLTEKSVTERELERKDQALQVALLKIKDLEYAKENFLEFQDQAKTQVQKLANYVDLEKDVEKLKCENVRLKDEVKNKLLLEEEVHDLKSRLTHYKEQEKRIAALQAEQVQTQVYLNEWRSVARGICEVTGSDSSLPHLLRCVVERLQQQEISLTSSKVELESQLSTALYEQKVAKTELEKSQKLLVEMKKTIEQKQNLFHRMQKKLGLVSRERDSYRLQLDSYEKDLTMAINPPSNAPHTSQLQSQKERIESLEKIVDNYRELNAKLESDLQSSNPSLYSEHGTNKTELLVKLQDEVEQLKLENDMLKQKRDQLEIQLEGLLVGQDTLHGGKVYHLGNNPLAECLAQREQLVEKLEQEVERLKIKIKKLEEGIESSKLGESALCPEEIHTLKEQIKTHESQTQRLKDYFKSSLHEFRNVIYMLLGYKIDRTSTSLYKLTSIYAERAEDQLCFQLNNEGNLNLLENEFSSTLEEMVNLHLRHQKSIPVFLSSLTIDLFNNSTMATKTFEIE
ncbi:mitotic spindle assembly checkpoint protein MAD1 [Zophobas morio]|uniref:mitotic spindle assembly checkpoint protein MAD1 n=1 Tax=Zophobas morio TaxID=2755281 RepID=UPI003082A5C9